MTNFDRRLAARKRELERLYMELYDDRAMLNALERAMAGFPMLSSGDEIAQLNDYDYRNDRPGGRTAGTCIAQRLTGTTPPNAPGPVRCSLLTP